MTHIFNDPSVYSEPSVCNGPVCNGPAVCHPADDERDRKNPPKIAHDHCVIVGLEAVLANKEARVERQREWLKRHALPLLSFCVNMPGPEKMNDLSKRIFQQGLKAIKGTCSAQGWPIVGEQILWQDTGPEAIFVVRCGSAMLLKKQMMAIERNHSLGRLMDLDVLDTAGKIISRQGQQMPRRQCLICDEDAAVCARSRKHSLNELIQRICEIVSHDPCRD